jgi:hypothetical protein
MNLEIVKSFVKEMVDNEIIRTDMGVLEYNKKKYML